MSFFAWIVLGLVSGFIGSRLVGEQGRVIGSDIVVGILGALIGGFLFNHFGARGVTGLNLWSLMVAVAGSSRAPHDVLCAAARCTDRLKRTLEPSTHAARESAGVTPYPRRQRKPHDRIHVTSTKKSSKPKSMSGRRRSI